MRLTVYRESYLVSLLRVSFTLYYYNAHNTYLCISIPTWLRVLLNIYIKSIIRASRYIIYLYVYIYILSVAFYIRP